MKAFSLLIALLFSASAFAQFPNATDAAKAAAAQAQTAGAKAQAAGAQAQAAGAKAQDAANGKTAAAKSGGLMVNINTATKEDLQKIPGIGPDKAQAIIANRPYGKIEDLTKVKGIKAAALAKIKPFITVK